MSHLDELEHLRIPLDHIISATTNFADHNFLGQGGFGRVYKGQLPPDHPSAGTTVAVKRLEVQLGQGDHEFLMEIVMLSRYKHNNLVSLIGFVDQGREKILVYKNEDNGSLDKHLDSTNLTWEQLLCGRFAMLVKCEDKQRRLLSEWVKVHYGKGKLDEIIFPGLVEQMKAGSLELFSKIAFKCLNGDRKLRPTMRSIVVELESALEHQLGKRITAPERQTGTRTKLWGSKMGGSPFLFQLQGNQKLRNITIYHRVFIEGITLTAEDSNGLSHFEQYGSLPYSIYGYVDRTVQKSEINLDAEEEIIGLSGSVGVYNGYYYYYFGGLILELYPSRL
ncbi:hypothetical protein L1987_25013 [Smallanthus sonchifolius]|uniref:Uncharacterized protein n=1 Tax=Smallanthus sonchifolius TaxID=185202 RepID=A0ACB9IMM0_9ASTR|nr:hypothetical protein L1987_25013 [Smallanthus sonchifolius]